MFWYTCRVLWYCTIEMFLCSECSHSGGNASIIAHLKMQFMSSTYTDDQERIEDVLRLGLASSLSNHTIPVHPYGNISSAVLAGKSPSSDTSKPHRNQSELRRISYTSLRFFRVTVGKMFFFLNRLLQFQQMKLILDITKSYIFWYTFCISAALKISACCHLLGTYI